jgi:prepilin-type N-terminal cleavage/methylation domain-containing protein
MIKKGFTVIELVVVLSIISLLTSLLLFGVSQVREAARRSQCQNRIHQSLLAIANFESAFQKMPSAANSKRLEESSPWIQILPYLEQSSLAERFSGIAILNRDTEPFIDEDFPQLKCPSDGNCKSSYRFSMGSHYIPYPVVRYEASGQGCFVYGRARAMSEFRSGLSYTACISEYSRSANPNGVGMYYFDV